MSDTTTPTGALRRWGPIVAMLVLLAGALVIGRGHPSETVTARAERIAEGIKCPTCQGLSVAQSKAGTARAIYAEIERRVRSGESDDSVRAYLVSRYGEEQLLRPEATGIGAVVWIVPVAGGVLALAAVGWVLYRSRPSGAAASAADRALVARARRLDATDGREHDPA